jgi:hypothetical protein
MLLSEAITKAKKDGFKSSYTETMFPRWGRLSRLSKLTDQNTDWVYVESFETDDDGQKVGTIYRDDAYFNLSVRRPE